MVAERLGFDQAYIRCFDNRFRNPLEAALSCCHLTVGELYDILVECGLPVLADFLQEQHLVSSYQVSSYNSQAIIGQFTEIIVYSLFYLVSYLAVLSVVIGLHELVQHCWEKGIQLEKGILFQCRRAPLNIAKSSSY